jgi:hypothetical protein
VGQNENMVGQILCKRPIVKDGSWGSMLFRNSGCCISLSGLALMLVAEFVLSVCVVQVEHR